VKVWSVESGECVSTLQHSSDVESVSFSPDGQWIASASSYCTVKVWSVESGECVTTLKGHSSDVTSVSFSPDGQWIASGSDDNTVKVWSVESGECVTTLEGHSSAVYSVSFSPDGQWIASGSDDKTVKVWSVESGEYVLGPECEIRARIKRPLKLAVDAKIEARWKARTGTYYPGKVVSRNEIEATYNVLFDDGDTRDEIPECEIRARVRTLEGHSWSVYSVSFSPDGQWIASGSYDNTVKVWSVKSGECVTTLEGHSFAVWSVSFSPDGTLIASGSFDKTVKVWSVESGECVTTLEGHSREVRSVSFSPDGQWIASGSIDRTVKVWRVKSGECVTTLEGHSDGVTSVSFSPGGAFIVSGSGDKTVKVWSVESGECVRMLEGHSDQVESVSFSPDGQWIASGSDDKTVKVWSVESGECVTTFKGHSNKVTSVSFSPDGQWIASGSWDKTVKVWSVESGECVFTGSQLDDSWRAVFKDHLPAQRFDYTQTIGMSGEGENTNPLVYIGHLHALVKDGPRIHILERRPVPPEDVMVQQLADCINLHYVGAKLVESCKQQPDLIPEVFGALKKLLQHKDGNVVSYGCRLVLEVWDEPMDIVQEILPLMTSASSEVRGLAREILLKVCTKQPDSVSEVLATARKLLQHDDEGIIENSCKVVLELCDETIDIVEKVLPLMESASIKVRGLAREILLKMCTKQPDLVPEVVAAARTLLQHDDDGIVVNSCKVVLELCSNPTQLLEPITGIRKLLSKESNPPIDHVIQAGIVPRLIEFLSDNDHPKLQFEAAWLLTNIASGTSEHVKVVVNDGVLPPLVVLLRSQDKDAQEQTIWALGNIAGDSPDMRNKVVESGAIAPVLNILGGDATVSIKKNAAWALSNFCRGKPKPPFDAVRPALPTLAQLLFEKDENILADACWALSYLSDGPNKQIQAVIESGVCSRLVELLNHSSSTVQVPALRAVGNIVTGDERQTETMLECDVVPALLGMLSSSKKGIVKEACWTLSNITAGNSAQIQRVLDAGGFPRLIELLANAEDAVKKEAAWAISNATSGGTPEQISFLVAQGCVPPLCELLEFRDAKIVTVALEGLENILKKGATMAEGTPTGENPYALTIERAQGLEKIDNLQNHHNNDIYERAVKILEKYFDAVEEVL